MSQSEPMRGDEFKFLLERSKEVFECSWAVGVVRDESVGRSRPVLIFYDSSGGKFSHAFSFPAGSSINELCERLLKADQVSRENNLRVINP